jgi:HEAT repeat protein
LFQPTTPPPKPESDLLVSEIFNQSLPLQIRRQAARSLAKLGTDEAMNALKLALTNDSPAYLKVAIAEGLGESPNPEARDLLHELANGKNEAVARGAVRGMALRGDQDSVDALGNLLSNEQTPISVRTESALGLGDVDLSTAQDILTRIAAQTKDTDILESALDGLGRRPFSETEEFFRGYLSSPDVPPESKVMAIQSIADSDADVAGFLKPFLTDPNPDVRAAAVEAVGSTNSDNAL